MLEGLFPLFGASLPLFPFPSKHRRGVLLIKPKKKFNPAQLIGERLRGNNGKRSDGKCSGKCIQDWSNYLPCTQPGAMKKAAIKTISPPFLPLPYLSHRSHMLIDTHAHLYSHKFDSDRPDMVRRAIAAGVERMYLPNIDSESIQPMLDLEAAFPENCFVMMGLHPSHVQPDTYERELALVEKHLGERTWAGVGETGIDLYWDKSTLDIQKISFARQLEWAKNLNLPVIIHSRESNRECLELVSKGQDGRLRGIFHCFSGTLEEGKEMIGLGFMLGVGGTLTYPKSGMQAVLKEIPLEHIVLETDSPYLTPVPHRGKRNESAYVRIVAEMLAEVKELPREEIAHATTANALQMFSVKL
jgi:TatD DNase family protein